MKVTLCVPAMTSDNAQWPNQWYINRAETADINQILPAWNDDTNIIEWVGLEFPHKEMSEFRSIKGRVAHTEYQWTWIQTNTGVTHNLTPIKLYTCTFVFVDFKTFPEKSNTCDFYTNICQNIVCVSDFQISGSFMY